MGKVIPIKAVSDDERRGKKYRYGYVLDDLTQDELKAELSYDKKTGIFMRLTGPRAGLVAGSRNPADGNIQIRVGPARRLYLAHRLAWLYVEGYWPPDEIDHDDGNRSNNRWMNLFLATHAENHQNVKMRIDNKSGVKGVNWCRIKKAWIVRIQVNNVRPLIGYYENIEDARRAAAAAKARLHTFHPVQRRT